jgi:hypothetical protein
MSNLMVTVQYQENKKPHNWKTAFRARLLYADSKIILVRGAGSHSMFRANGLMSAFGCSWKTDSAFGRLHEAHSHRMKWLRIAPTSLEKIKAEVALGDGEAPAF